MKRPAHENDESRLAARYLHSIHYQSPAGDNSYRDALGILKNIFDASGQKHLLYLVKLRKLWFEKVDNFLARHSYPRNLSVLSHFTVDYDFVEKLSQAGLDQDILKVVDQLITEDFKNQEQFIKRLQKKMKHALVSKDETCIKKQIRLIPKQTILHLTVYDGSIAQALRFESQAYLRMLHQLLPEMKLDNIRCHVGDMGMAQFDQRLVAHLAKQWLLIVPDEVQQKSVPAFIHRVSDAFAVLVLYVGSAEALEYLKRYPGAEWLKNELQIKIPEMRDSIHKIAFVIKSELNLEQARYQSILMGNIPENVPTDSESSNQEMTIENDDEGGLSRKMEFAKINENLRKKLETR